MATDRELLKAKNIDKYIEDIVRKFQFRVLTFSDLLWIQEEMKFRKRLSYLTAVIE